MYNEIMLPYAGIIRIRFLGMISATVVRGTPANISTNIYLVLFIYAILEKLSHLLSNFAAKTRLNDMLAIDKTDSSDRNKHGYIVCRVWKTA